jgi:hypothetical protein
MFKNKNILISALKNEDKKCHSFFYLIKRGYRVRFPMTLYTFYGLFFSYQEVTCQKTAVANSYYSKPLHLVRKLKFTVRKK